MTQMRATGVPGAPRPGNAPTPPLPRYPPSHLSMAELARRAMMLLLILLISYAALRGIHILLEAFAGVLFAIFLTTLAEWLRKATGIAYHGALTFVVLALVALMCGLGWLLANRVAMQVSELTQQLPRSFQEIQDYLKEYAWGRLLLQEMPRTTASLGQQIGGFSRLTGLVASVAGFLEAVVVIFVVGIFGAAEPELYRKGVLHLVPARNRGRVDEALDAVVYNLRSWLVGQFILMVLIGITTSIGLWLIGVRLALLLGLITGIMELVPYIGAWLSAIPAALMALLLGPSELVMTLGLYLGLHLLEGYVLVPFIQKRAVEMAPALTLVMQVLLGELLGFLGLFVAAPLTVVFVVLVKMLYIEDALGDETVEVPGEAENGKAGSEQRTLNANP
jgi:predicted PurR-regulated permease PerM